MKKKLTIILFLLFSSIIVSQENKITISPVLLTGWSSIKIDVEKKGTYILKIKDSEGEEILKKKVKISNNKTIGFKYNFQPLKKGIYRFELFKNSTLILKKNITKHKQL